MKCLKMRNKACVRQGHGDRQLGPGLQRGQRELYVRRVAIIDDVQRGRRPDVGTRESVFERCERAGMHGIDARNSTRRSEQRLEPVREVAASRNQNQHV